MTAYTPQEARTRETFLALMWALSNPGRAQIIPYTDSFIAIGDSLLDLETSYYTPDANLAAALQRTGARALEPERAAYHFYPQLTALDGVEAASTGTMLYPDQAATLLIGCAFDAGQTLRLTGPGIATSLNIRVNGIDPAFWSLRQQVNHYPLGWDVFLIAGQQVIGLPRTTQILSE